MVTLTSKEKLPFSYEMFCLFCFVICHLIISEECFSPKELLNFLLLYTVSDVLKSFIASNTESFLNDRFNYKNLVSLFL